MTDDAGPAKNGAVADDGLDRKTLFVRAVPFDATSEDLSQFFSQFVPVKHAVVVTDASKQAKGFGFVSFTMADDTLTALVEARKNKFKGRFLRVDMAKRRDRKEKDADAHTAPVPAVEKRRARLIVRNLPWSCKKPEQLKKLFSKYGAVYDAYIPKKKGGQMRGFAFVVMKKTAAAERAVKESEGLTIDGREVAVDLALEKSKWEQVQEEESEAEEEEEEEEEDEEEKDDEEEGETAEEKGDVDAEEKDDAEETPETSDSDADSDADADADEELNFKQQPERKPKNKQEPHAIFVRNIPYDATDEALKQHFSQFGAVKYALAVKDRETGLAKGSAFVAFHREDAYIDCIDNAPEIANTSLLLPDDVDGKYVFEGRVLNISSAVDRNSASQLADRNALKRKEAMGKDLETDKRNFFLLNEGRVTENSKLAALISKTDLELRDKSYKLRVQQLKSNPTLHLSLTRLAIRNLPRAMTSKSLKALGRRAVVQFATEVKEGLRQPLSKEEVKRSISTKQDDQELEDAKANKSKHAGVVKQAKVIMEVKGSGDVGRSRGYGFLEFRDHKSALMGLRWLNVHEVTPDEITAGMDDEQKKLAKLEGVAKRRLIAEFAIENAQVVKRRRDNVFKARNKDPEEKKAALTKKRPAADDDARPAKKRAKQGNMNKGPKPETPPETPDNIKKLIGQKRMKRKGKK